MNLFGLLPVVSTALAVLATMAPTYSLYGGCASVGKMVKLTSNG